MLILEIIKLFKLKYNVLVERKDTVITIPKISSSLPIVKLMESFSNMLSYIIGSRNILLAYVIRPEVSVLPTSSIICAADHLYSIEQDSISNELTARARYNHSLFNEDNAKVYFPIEEAVHNTNYATSIKPFQRSKNGRGALLSLKYQYCVKDK